MTEKFLMARNFYRIFTENNPVMGDSKTFGIPEAKGLRLDWIQPYTAPLARDHSVLLFELISHLTVTSPLSSCLCM